MHPIITKPLDSLTADDVHSAISEALPEGQHLEFKAAPTDPLAKPIFDSHGKLTQRFKASMLEEVCAFANSDGGTLVIGIQESDSKPAIASSITPIPNCAEVAEATRLVIRDCLSPTIAKCHSVGVVTSDDGTSGIVVVRVPGSLHAPHRREFQGSSLDCYVRRADRSEKLQMHEIQDLTLRISRNIDRVENEFLRAREGFDQWFRNAQTDGRFAEAAAFRITAVPVSARFGYTRVHNVPELRLVRRSWAAACTGATRRDVESFTSRYPQRVFLRSTRAKGHTSSHALSVTLHGDGRIETAFGVSGHQNEGWPTVYPSHLVAHLADTLDLLDRYRIYRGAPDCEYGLEVGVRSTRARWYLAPFGDQASFGQDDTGVSPFNRIDFPAHSVAATAGFNDVINSLWTDINDYLGCENAGELFVDFTAPG